MPVAMEAEPASAAMMPSVSKCACGEYTSSTMPSTPSAAEAHAMIGGCFLPTHHVSTRTISVCVELRMAASPPGNR